MVDNVTPTENLGLRQIPEHFDGWHDIYNEDQETIDSAISSIESGGNASEYRSEGTFGPTTPSGDHHNSPAGLVIDPKEPVVLRDAVVDADSAGTLTVHIYGFLDGVGGHGYPDDPMQAYHFDVGTGTNTVTFDQPLYPLPDEYIGYAFSINESDVSLRRDDTESMPHDVGPAILRGGSANSGSLFDAHYHFFNLTLKHDRVSGGLYGRSAGGIGAEVTELNGYHFVPSSVRDWGATMNETIANAKEGDVILVGPGYYFTGETVTVDKNLSIIGLGANGDLRDPTGPMITPAGNFDVIESGHGVGMGVEGLNFNGENVTTGRGVVCHGRSTLRHLTADRWNDHFIHMHQESSEDNLNSSKIEDVSGRSVDGAVVYLSNDSAEQRELNSQSISVRLSFSNDWAINADEGFGNFYYVQQMEGTHSGAGVRLNVQRSVAVSTYVESNVRPIFQFTDAQNTAMCMHAGGASIDDMFQFDHSNNMGIQFCQQTEPFIIRPYGTVDFAGGSIETTDPGAGLILTAPDGSRHRLEVTNSGSLTVDSL